MNPHEQAQSPGGSASPSGQVRSRGFTLIELMLVMAILTIAISLVAPALANFFRGRSLDSEARRLLALTREGQSRAISEGMPMDLWVDAEQGNFGLEMRATYEEADTRAVEFTLATEMSIEVVEAGKGETSLSGFGDPLAARGRRLDLPRIRFHPDGSVDESSPRAFRLVGRDGRELLLVQARNRVSYEIQAPNQ